MASASTGDGFDPNDAGTPESVWQAWMPSLPVLGLPEGPVTVVAPHPDDESLGAGGLIFDLCSAGREVTVILATDGEAAAKVPELGAWRRREFQRALDWLGGPRKLCLQLPDGGLAEHGPELEAAIEEIVDARHLLLAPYVGDRHPDHLAVARATEAVSRRLGCRSWQYPVWAWHHGEPAGWPPAIRYALSPNAMRAKKAALDGYVSQRGGKGFPPVLPQRVMAYFERPWEVFIDDTSSIRS